ncbi:MAG: aminotransferase class V-fold PLP-dependent enzyme, partial [Planctomycetota bacterium]|nr:aminotransferase class V-fold PLP-dependent enzyme [Planctomycetota bacterium]
MYKQFYSRFHDANSGFLHFAAHSHHPWPDVSRDAHQQYWDDSIRLVDRKWEYIFSEIIPKAQGYLADWLNTGEPGQIVFAPNTHELLYRVLSCFLTQERIRILTSDSEFHSFDRQIRRLIEVGLAEVDVVDAMPFGSFQQRFRDCAITNAYDLIFVSSIFFSSGLGVPDLDSLVRDVHVNATATVIDGYHSFAAVPVDLGSIKNQMFFLAGGYKYAQGGEGVCFMHVPRSCALVPLQTGWYAGFTELERKSTDLVSFPSDGQRFAGATFDPSGIYRLNAVMELFHQQGLDQESISGYVKDLQCHFLKCIEDSS